MIESRILCSCNPILASTTIFKRPTASSFATPAPPGTALALRATSSRPSTCALGRCVLREGKCAAHRTPSQCPSGRCGAGEQPCGHPSRVLCGELPGGSSISSSILALLGRQHPLQLSARQPAQPSSGCPDLTVRIRFTSSAPCLDVVGMKSHRPSGYGWAPSIRARTLSLRRRALARATCWSVRTTCTVRPSSQGYNDMNALPAFR